MDMQVTYLNTFEWLWLTCVYDSADTKDICIPNIDETSTSYNWRHKKILAAFKVKWQAICQVKDFTTFQFLFIGHFST